MHVSIYVSLCMCLYLCVSIYVSTDFTFWVKPHGSLHTCIYLRVYVCICLRLYVCLCLCVYRLDLLTLTTWYFESMHLSTGWRWCTGRLKLQDSFRKRAANYRALLQKLTYKDKASYASLPPCMCLQTNICIYICVDRLDLLTLTIWQIPLKILHPRTPPNAETQISRYKFKFNQNLNLNFTARYRDI